MKKINFIVAVIIFFAVNLSATNHIVSTVGNTFSPASLTITVGDSVTFVNAGGSHNVNGTIATFPLNPASFINPGGVSSGWTYIHVFTIAGNYGYQCDPHSPAMVGQITVNSAPQLVVTTTSATSVTSNDGQAIATTIAGVGPYTYYWENLSTGLPAFGPTTTSAISDTFVNAPSGTYILSFIDNGASFFTTDTFTITAAPAAGNFSYSGSMGLCGVATTNLTAYLNGCAYPNPVLGTEYILTDNLGVILLSSTLFVDSVVLPSLGAGTYYLSALNYDNGCTATDTITIATGVLGSNVLSTNIVNATLGSAAITAFGGTAPYFICWQDPLVAPPCQTIMTWNNGDTLSNLAAGIYTYTIIGSGGCNVVGSIIIENACSAQLTSSYDPCDAEVYFDAAMNMVNPGIYSYDYELADGVSTVELQTATTATTTFLNPITSSGMYYLTATETTTGCIAMDSINVVMNPITVNSIVNNITNPIVCSGSIFITPITGQFPYTFTWDTAGVNFSNNTGPISNLTALCENTYCLTIIDGNGCTYNECYDVLFTPCDVSVSVFDSIPCYGGVGLLQVDIDTNNLPLGPLPLPGPRYTYELFTTNPLAPVGAPQLSNNFSFIFPNLLSNNYLVTVFDASYGTYCSSDSLYLSQPNPIVIYTTADSASAPWINDGQITIDSITGGTQPYSIQWFDSVGIPLPTFGNLIQDSLGYSNQYNGGYTISITDSIGCPGSSVVYVHPKNSGDSLRIDAYTITHPTCYGDCDGELWMQMYGVGTYSVPPFTFVWSDIATGDTLKIDSLGSPWYNTNSHVATYVNRCAGVYSLMAYDYYGNEISSILEFPALVNPDSLYVQLGADIVIDCGEDTLLTSLVVGGNVLNDTVLVSTQILSLNNAAIGFSDTLNSGMNYLLVVSGVYQDGSGNMYDAAYDFTTLPATPVMNWLMDAGTTHRPNPDLYQGNHIYNFPFIGNGIHDFYIPNLGSGFNGNLTFNLYQITFDTTIYNYSWITEPPSNPVVISTIATALAYPGVNGTDYILTVEDANACEASDTINVSWDLYILNFDTVSVTDVLCNGDSSGSIIVTADTSTGFSPYTSYVNGIATTDSLPTGSYIVYIEDAVGCLTQDSTVIITEPDSLYACGIDTALISVLVDAFNMTFDTVFNYTTNLPTQLGLEYQLVVSGTYFDQWNTVPPVSTKDAAYQFNISPELAINEWSWNGTTLRPNLDIYDPATHTYVYDFIGDGNNQVFTYTDLSGDYINNGGNLIFELYKFVCSKTDTAYTCYGDSTATATVYPEGGTPFIDSVGNPYYNVVWESNSGVVWGTNTTVTGLPTGIFTAIITDSLGCIYERKLIVLQSTDPFQIDSYTQTNVMCKGDSTGIIDAVVSGGWGSSISVLMNGTDTIYSEAGQLTNIQITGLPVGVYDFSIFDTIPDGLYGIYGCMKTVQITIIEPQDYLSSIVNDLSPGGGVTCWGDSIASAVVNVIGGQFPYTYLWDNGETNNIATALWAGWQGVTFTDSNGCILRDSIEIISLYPEITGLVSVLEQNSCFNSCDAIATLSTLGGVLPHTYFWDVGQVSINMPDTAFNLCAGGHDILVEDALGCRNTISFIVTEPDELFAQALMTQPVQCFGFNDGTAFGSATGGTPIYTLVWDSINGQAGQNATSLTPGIHTLYVTDSKGCTASDTVVITEPTQLEVDIIDSMTVYSYCSGTNSGQLCAIASGGIPNYNYVWTGGQSNYLPLNSMSCAINLIAGTYTVIVMDDRNCIASTVFDLDSITNAMTPSGVSMTVVDVSCFGDYNGSVTIDSVAGAVNPLTYTWTPSVGIINSISSLYAGSYAVVVEDSNGCAITVNAEVGEPDQLEYTTYNVIDANCFGACNGEIWVNVEGGTGGYYYDDSEAGDFSVPFPNPIQLINDSLIFDLCAGLHDVYITDDNGCEGAVVWGGSWQEFVDSGVVITPPMVLYTNASCWNSNDGSAWIPWNPLDGTGGNSLYTYTWETSGGVQIDTGSTTSILYPGNYVLVAHYSDSANFGQVYSGCDASSSVFTIVGPSEIFSGANSIDVTCYSDADGSIILNPTGGLGTYTYLWDVTTSISVSDTSVQNHANLQPGTYTVTITDGNGCVITEAITVGEPDALTASISFTAPLCNGGADGSALIVVDGGVLAYGYAWDNGGGIASTTLPISAGVYTCSVTDGNSCQASFSVTVTEPSNINAAVEANSFFGSDELGLAYNVSCHGDNNGTAIVTNGGGVGIFTYSWTTIPVQTTNPATDLGSGVYTVTVTDENGCTDAADVTINEPDTLVANGLQSGQTFLSGFDISCYGLSDGWIELDPTGGVASNGNIYQYEWTGPSNGNSAISQSIYNLIEGSYGVTITDANGCKYDTSFVLTQPEDTFVVDVTTINYAGPVHGPATILFIDATTTSTNDPVNHDWYWDGYYNDPQSSSNSAGMIFTHVFSELGINNIYVLVENVNSGCIDSVPFAIEVQGVPEIYNVFSPNNDGINDDFTFGEFGMENVDAVFYNRWGQEVYSWTGENRAWDGKGADGQDLPEGVYFFIFKADGIDGYYYEEKGSITIIR